MHNLNRMKIYERMENCSEMGFNSPLRIHRLMWDQPQKQERQRRGKRAEVLTELVALLLGMSGQYSQHLVKVRVEHEKNSTNMTPSRHEDNAT